MALLLAAAVGVGALYLAGTSMDKTTKKNAKMAAEKRTPAMEVTQKMTTGSYSDNASVLDILNDPTQFTDQWVEFDLMGVPYRMMRARSGALHRVYTPELMSY